ncbi:MAG: hypothetical protein IH991_18185 [Planctomycetes bacterium]|nr:hypothetical protein [Planctomycetota bacterium]
MNSGAVIHGKLYCAHSTWPAKPCENSIEIWNANTLEHLESRPLKETAAAVTWVDRHDGHWWIVFAHYGDEASVRKTTLVKLDDKWQVTSSFRFPLEVVRQFVPFSNSGGSWGPDGLLYATGHDREEMYALRLPKQGALLELVKVVPINVAGQGIAWDRSDVGVVYGIRRKKKEVVVSRLSHSAEYDDLKQAVKWKRDARNPILPPGEPGSFDATRCMNPWIRKNDNQYQLYYSGGDDRGRQRVCLATATTNDIGTWKRVGPLFETGREGAFDARWCVLPHVVQVALDRWHLYYTGNAGRGAGLSAFPGIGLATSRDGKKWSRSADPPTLQPSKRTGDPDAVGIAGGSVLQVKLPRNKSEWRFYYTGCPTVGKPLTLNQQKTICLAVSQDGVRWQKRGAVMFRDPARDYENIGVAGPVVHQNTNGGFRMWYSAIGTRWGYYSICYAESDDGIHWRRGSRDGDNLQLAPDGDGWERQMVEYPTIIAEGDRLRLFYCGNGYGRTGIGTAISVSR